MSDRQDQERGWDGASIDRVFDLGSTEEVSGARASAEGLESDAVAELRGLCREALTGEPAREATLQASRVAERVIGRTTREDLGRRGDLGLVLQFVGDRLRDSAVLRVAVAVLIVQVTVVPLVAWHLLKEAPRGGVRFVLEPAPERAFEEERPEEEGLSVVGGSSWWELDGAEPWLQADADLEGGAARLRQLRASFDPGEIRPTTSTGLALARWMGIEAEELHLAEASPLIDSILNAETALAGDRTGQPWSGLEQALEEVGRTLELGRSMVDSAEPGPIAILASRALLRAGSMGLVAPAPDRRLPVPSPEAWLLMIAAEAAGAAPGDPFVARWVRAVREL